MKKSVWYLAVTFFSFFLFFHLTAASVYAQFLPIEIDVEFPEPTSIPSPAQTPEPSPSVLPTPIPSVQPTPRSTPSATPEPTVIPTPEPVVTPPPIITQDDFPDPTVPPFAGGPEIRETVIFPEVIEQIQEQVNDPDPITNEQVAQTPGEIISPIIPRDVLDRIIPSGLYKEDGLNPVDGLALLIFGVGFLLSGIALLRPDAFLPALADWERSLRRKSFLKRDEQTVLGDTR